MIYVSSPPPQVLSFLRLLSPTRTRGESRTRNLSSDKNDDDFPDISVQLSGVGWGRRAHDRDENEF